MKEGNNLMLMTRLRHSASSPAAVQTGPSATRRANWSTRPAIPGGPIAGFEAWPITLGTEGTVHCVR